MVEVTPRPGLRERKKARVRADLTDAAFRLFAVRGFDATTVDDIAEAVEVSRTTFFRYFETKESVVLGYLADVALQARAAVLARPAHEPPLAALRAGLLEVATAAAVADGRAAVLERLRRDSPAVRAAYRQKIEDWQQHLAAAVAERLGVDVEATLEARVYAGAAMAAVSAATDLWEATGRTEDIAALIDRGFDLVTP